MCIYDPAALALGRECFSGDCLGIVSYASGKGKMKNTLKGTHGLNQTAALCGTRQLAVPSTSEEWLLILLKMAPH